MLQAPQWARSLSNTTQEPSQLVCPEGHDTWQVPFPQTSPGLQALSQAPQWSRLLVTEKQASALLQYVCPTGHLAFWHCPFTQYSSRSQLEGSFSHIMQPTSLGTQARNFPGNSVEEVVHFRSPCLQTAGSGQSGTQVSLSHFSVSLQTRNPSQSPHTARAVQSCEPLPQPLPGGGAHERVSPRWQTSHLLAIHTGLSDDLAAQSLLSRHSTQPSKPLQNWPSGQSFSEPQTHR